VHYYNYASDCEDYTTYPQARFVSEHGFQSFPSMDTYKHVIEAEDMSRDSDLLAYRQVRCRTEPKEPKRSL
jgi:beta-mannosidase